ncbi:hypothetical protein L9F63_013963, partial [Diploptera punctata]
VLLVNTTQVEWGFSQARPASPPALVSSPPRHSGLLINIAVVCLHSNVFPSIIFLSSNLDSSCS